MTKSISLTINRSQFESGTLLRELTELMSVGRMLNMLSSVSAEANIFPGTKPGTRRFRIAACVTASGCYAALSMAEGLAAKYKEKPYFSAFNALLEGTDLGPGIDGSQLDRVPFRVHADSDALREALSELDIEALGLRALVELDADSRLSAIDAAGSSAHYALGQHRTEMLINHFFEAALDFIEGLSAEMGLQTSKTAAGAG